MRQCPHPDCTFPPHAELDHPHGHPAGPLEPPPLSWRHALACWWALPPRVRFSTPVWHARLIWRNLLARARQ